MKLRAISIQNFRCIEKVTVDIRDFTSFIGPNNCGKSSVLQAIHLLLNQHSPTIDEWRKGHKDKPIVIEAGFDKVEEWESAASAGAGLVYDGKIRLRVTFSIDPKSEKVQKLYEAFKPEETITGWAERWNDVSSDIKELATKLGISKAGEWKGVAKLEQVKKKIREVRPDLIVKSEPKWSDESISIDSALQQVIPQAQIIPAVRDAVDDSKPGTKTSFGVILSKVILPAVQAIPEYSDLTNAITRLQERLASTDAEKKVEKVNELTKLISERLSEVIDARVFLRMDTPDAEKFIGANTGLELDDGTKTSIGLQGNGLQRSLVFALMEALAAQNAQISDETGKVLHARSTIILFEEPELFLHPHIMRSLKRSLRRISQKQDWQVVVTTHSPFLIDIGEDPQSLAIFKRDDSKSPPKVTQLQNDPFGQDDPSKRDREALRAVLDFHPTVCEAFFAKRTILVEGDSETALLTHNQKLYEKAGVDMEKRKHCTVVSCGGKWTIAPIANLLRQFDIPFRVIHDRDRKNRSEKDIEEAIAIDPYKANARIGEFVPPENIYLVEDTLEDLFWEPEQRSSSSGDKPYRVWKRVQEITDGKLQPNPKLFELLKFAFNW
jgi:predicted ATP-dependent endonuclease of OLD family